MGVPARSFIFRSIILLLHCNPDREFVMTAKWYRRAVWLVTIVLLPWPTVAR